MTWGRLLMSALVALGLGAAFWLTRGPRSNVILITIDTMRADRISAYGYTKHVTPNLDRLAKEGVLFESAFCDVTWTTPSMTSVMTGLYAAKHGFRSSYETLKSEATTLAEVMHDHGYQTAAIIASYPLHSIFGLNQGFDLYDQEFSAPLMIDPQLEFGPVPPRSSAGVVASEQMKAVGDFLVAKAASDAYRPDPDVSERVVQWLRHERHGPFFLWIHYFGPHEKPTGITDTIEDRRVQMAAYDPDVLIADSAIGRVLDALDELRLTDHTVVIVHADHGQSLGEQDYFGHGRNVYDATQRIPLIIRAPGLGPRGERVHGLARNVDLLPTILDVTSMPIPASLDGASLRSALTGSVPRERVSTYVETYLSATSLFSDLVDPATGLQVGFRRVGVRSEDWKYVINDPIPLVDRDIALPEEVRRKYYSTELYDLNADPGETTNVVAQHADLDEHFRNEVWDQQRSRDLTQPIVLDESTRDRLRALGYLAD